MIYFD
jgi:hypothetical protein